MAVKSTNELGESNDLKFLESFLTEKLEGYTFVTLQHRSPVNFGFPMLRPRFYVVGPKGQNLAGAEPGMCRTGS